ncbi:MAG TPA: magnesium transporter [Gammaproteobacteria bacterium]|jgi:magnesium transporter|nr:magnesium transporter [Gammaproteobacteria bacterium]
MTETPEKSLSTHDHIKDVSAIIHSGSFASAKSILQAMHPAEIADLLESQPPHKRQFIWRMVDREFEGEVLMELGDEVRESLVEDMDTEQLRLISEHLDLDDLADFIQSLPEQLNRELLAHMDFQDRRRLESVLSYPEDSAGGLMDLDIITVRADVTLDVVLRYLRRRGSMPRHTDRLIVIDRFGYYLGALPLRRLLTCETTTIVDEVMRSDVPTIHVDQSDSEVARVFEDHDLVSAAVVDDKNKLLGRITIDDVVDVIRDEAEQSVMSMAGLNQEDDIFAPVIRSSRKRAVWLGVNLLTAFLAAWVTAQFADTIDKVVTLAILMTIVPSMGGIAGSQTLTIVIRGQALGQVNRTNTRWLLFKEIMVGLMNGTLWACVVGAVTYWWFGDMDIGLVIGLAILTNLAVAAMSGVMIPIVLRWLKVDPALAGGVILTTITDVIGLLAFLGLATLILL